MFVGKALPGRTLEVRHAGREPLVLGHLAEEVHISNVAIVLVVVKVVVLVLARELPQLLEPCDEIGRAELVGLRRIDDPRCLGERLDRGVTAGELNVRSVCGDLGREVGRAGRLGRWRVAATHAATQIAVATACLHAYLDLQGRRDIAWSDREGLAHARGAYLPSQQTKGLAGADVLGRARHPTRAAGSDQPAQE